MFRGDQIDLATIQVCIDLIVFLLRTLNLTSQHCISIFLSSPHSTVLSLIIPQWKYFERESGVQSAMIIGILQTLMLFAGKQDLVRHMRQCAMPPSVVDLEE